MFCPWGNVCLCECVLGAGQGGFMRQTGGISDHRHSATAGYLPATEWPLQRPASPKAHGQVLA